MESEGEDKVVYTEDMISLEKRLDSVMEAVVDLEKLKSEFEDMVSLLDKKGKDATVDEVRAVFAERKVSVQLGKLQKDIEEVRTYNVGALGDEVSASVLDLIRNVNKLEREVGMTLGGLKTISVDLAKKSDTMSRKVAHTFRTVFESSQLTVEKRAQVLDAVFRKRMNEVKECMDKITNSGRE